MQHVPRLPTTAQYVKLTNSLLKFIPTYWCTYLYHTSTCMFESVKLMQQCSLNMLTTISLYYTNDINYTTTQRPRTLPRPNPHSPSNADCSLTIKHLPLLLNLQLTGCTLLKHSPLIHILASFALPTIKSLTHYFMKLKILTSK